VSEHRSNKEKLAMGMMGSLKLNAVLSTARRTCTVTMLLDTCNPFSPLVDSPFKFSLGAFFLSAHRTSGSGESNHSIDLFAERFQIFEIGKEAVQNWRGSLWVGNGLEIYYRPGLDGVSESWTGH
jgi:hypothetical protein